MKDRLIICISREYGSGGREVGRKLAERLGIPCYDKELLTKTAQEHGISEAAIEAVDEQPAKWSSMGFPMGIRNPYQADYEDALYYVMNDKVFHMQAETIRHIASEGSCVLIGRAAEEVLKDDPDMVSFFIYADKADRVKRIMALEDIDAQKADLIIRKMDKKRANYNNYYSDKKWGVCTSYDFAISSSRFGLDGTVDIIQSVLEKV